MPEADFAALDAVGLNLHAVFALDQLPDALRDALRNECDAARNYSQLLLIGNGGGAIDGLEIHGKAPDRVMVTRV